MTRTSPSVSQSRVRTTREHAAAKAMQHALARKHAADKVLPQRQKLA